MNPYYERDGIAIYHADCREVDFPTADLLLTDPPYGVSFQSNRRTASDKFDTIKGDNDARWVAPALDAIVKQSLRHYRHAYVFGPDDLLPERLTAKVQMVWNKVQLGSGDLTIPWSKSHEPITFAVHVPSKANRSKGEGRMAARLRQGSVLTHTRPHAAGVKRHPTEKPVPLLRQLIESSSCMGEVVLDPFLGCGSTLVAAIAEGRVGAGCEFEERYAEISAKRCDAALDAMVALGGVLA